MYLFVFLSAAFIGIYNAAGRSKIPFFISGAGLLMNIVLDPLFIFGFGLGTNGAAYATWLSQGTVFGLFVYQLRCRDALLGSFPFAKGLILLGCFAFIRKKVLSVNKTTGSVVFSTNAGGRVTE